MYLLVGVFLCLLFLIVVVTALILCNKRHHNDKGLPLPIKSTVETDTSGSPVINMYTASSDTILPNEMVFSPSKYVYHQLTPTSYENTKKPMANLADSPHRNSTEEEINDGTILTFWEYGNRASAATLPKYRRSCISDFSTAGNLTTPDTTLTLSKATPGLNTIIRGSKTQDISRENGRIHMRNYSNEIAQFALNGTMSSPLSPRNSGHSANGTPNCSSPPLLSVPKRPIVGSPSECSSPADASATLGHSRLHMTEDRFSETKYIISHEVMRKPGTAV
ncbi:hypothetical protein SK128_013536 [Halocaridina rubra]|uniref:Uncharacterized protein n=1 Tax=Halocaridina rubra TaxID=373956 RepID=A0AAN9AE31_HALRR